MRLETVRDGKWVYRWCVRFWFVNWFFVLVGPSGGIRKAKRVSDVNALGAPSPTPAFSPGAPYAGYPPAGAGPPPLYSEGIQLDAPDFGTPAPPAPAGSKWQLESSEEIRITTTSIDYMTQCYK